MVKIILKRTKIYDPDRQWILSSIEEVSVDLNICEVRVLEKFNDGNKYIRGKDFEYCLTFKPHYGMIATIFLYDTELFKVIEIINDKEIVLKSIDTQCIVKAHLIKNEWVVKEGTLKKHHKVILGRHQRFMVNKR